MSSGYAPKLLRTYLPAYRDEARQDAEQTPFASTYGKRRHPEPPPCRDPKAAADPKAVVPYARHARHEMAEQAGYYDRPLTNEEIRLLERPR